MEISWKWLNLYLGLIIIGFCTGFPLNLEDTNTGHTQFLTVIAAVGIAVGSIVLAGCLCCQRRKGFKEFHNNPVVVSSVSVFDHGHVNPTTNGEFTIFAPLSSPLSFNNSVFLAKEQRVNIATDDYACGDIDIAPWFRNTKDFPRSKLKYIRELGNGCFGKVVEGAAQDLDPNRTWTPVVVRIADAACTPWERIHFLNDALFYLAPPHPNLLALKGRCLNATPLLLLQESCTGGDLKTRLRLLGSEDKTLLWCYQLSSALRHLHDHGLIHPDLAARNCLLTDSLVLKVGDYALGSSKYPEDYYKGGQPLIPVRWRAPESLDCTLTTIQAKKLTKEANVWSLGVVMWEICENGSQPYGLLNDDEVISRVFGPEGLRLDGPSKPQIYSDYIFRLVKMCWSNAESRPKVSQIDIMLSDLLQVHKHTQDPLLNITDDFDERWNTLKPNIVVKTDNQSVGSDHNIISNKPMSTNVYSLHGSLDTREKSLEAAVNIDGESPSENINLTIKLSPSELFRNDILPDSPIQSDSLTDSMIFKQPGSSESDTEEESWRKKVERGAYSEKVRLKSRSVAELMVLTHVDCTESESEIAMPSFDYKLNKNFRKSNLENSSLNFSSAGNLLTIEDTFEKELKKLRVERRDSLLFVPEHRNQSNSNLSLLQELNSPTEIKPVNQIYNIFNMAIDNFCTLGINGSKINDVINIEGESRTFSRQNSESKSDLGYATLHNSERNSDFGSVDGEQLLEERSTVIKNEIHERLENCELHMNCASELSSKFGVGRGMEQVYDESDIVKVQIDKVVSFQRNKFNLPDILASLDQDHCQVNVDLLESNSLRGNEDVDQREFNLEENNIDVLCNTESKSTTLSQTINLGNLESQKNENSAALKLSDLLQQRCEMMQCVNDTCTEEAESVELVSQCVPDLCSENIECSDSCPYLGINYESNENHNPKEDEQVFVRKDSGSVSLFTKSETYSGMFSSEMEETIGPTYLDNLDPTEHGEATVKTNSHHMDADVTQILETSNETILLDGKSNNCSESPLKTESKCLKECSTPSEKYITSSDNNSDTGEKVDHKNASGEANLDTMDDVDEEFNNTLDITKNDLHSCNITSPEIRNYCENNLTYNADEVVNHKPTVTFDLSGSQHEIMPNTLTHKAIFTSTPSAKKKDASLPSGNFYCSLNLFKTQQVSEEPDLCYSNGDLFDLDVSVNDDKLNYSLETWDNFLGQSFDSNKEITDNCFDSFTPEPKSMLLFDEFCQNKTDTNLEVVQQEEVFHEQQNNREDSPKNQTFVKNDTFVKDGTFVIDDDRSYVMDVRKDETFVMNKCAISSEETSSASQWETGGGWFLHPPLDNGKISGEIEPQQGTNNNDTYIGFDVEDELMTAIRNELLEKLPHAQGSSIETATEDEKWNETDRSEVLLRYNVYNTPLSPIPEEMSSDNEEEEKSYRRKQVQTLEACITQ